MDTQRQPVATTDLARRHGLAMLLGRQRSDDLLAFRTAARLAGLTMQAKGHAA